MGKRKKRAAVAMSGGVDSSLAACLLKDKGFDVIGLTMKLIPEPEPGPGLYQADDSTPAGRSRSRAGCCSYLDTGDARQAAQKINIPHYVIDLTKNFEKKVIKDFCTQYLLARTPNPCIRCNQYIKFELLLNKARQLEADYIATGHYARIGYCSQNKRYLLQKGRDKDKDQTYALFTMTQEQLKSTLFPLGSLTKTQVRKLAKESGLLVHDKADSQEICFITDNNYKRFLKERYPGRIKPGDIVDLNNKVLGQHEGVSFYTIGQRKGLGVALGKPVYVVGLDVKNNKVILGDKKDLLKKELTAFDLNWISRPGLDSPLKAYAQIRYNHCAAAAMVTPLDVECKTIQGKSEKNKIKKTSLRGTDKIKVRFCRAQPAVTPGQAVVFYDKDVVIGGGWIE